MSESAETDGPRIELGSDPVTITVPITFDIDKAIDHPFVKMVASEASRLPAMNATTEHLASCFGCETETPEFYASLHAFCEKYGLDCEPLGETAFTFCKETRPR